jgi:4-hydroxybenzoate polyprenyltransferase
MIGPSTLSPTTDAPPNTAMLMDWLRLIRPQHWIKNVFLVFPLVFSRRFTEPTAITATLIAVVCFCAWSSAVYILNDVIDAPHDRAHPRKRRRPIAAGRIAPMPALGLAAALCLSAVVISSIMLPSGVLLLGGLYLLNNLLYCLLLKYRVVIDVISIAAGFALRILAGCSAITAEPSSWIIICGFSLALFLGFGKRRAEVERLGGASTAYRAILEIYTRDKLDTALAICCTMCLISYLLYTVAPETVEFHHGKRLVFSFPLVVYGMFRFLFKVQEGAVDGPVDVVLRDPVTLITMVLWLGACALLG